VDVVLALAAALLFSLGTVLQGQVASRASERDAGGAGFLLRLARRPRWLVGVGADALGFAAQAAALAVGRIVVVQPLLASSVVFSLPLGAKLDGRRMRPQSLVAALVVTAGLGAFLVVADPAGGREDASTAGWIGSFAVAALLSAVLSALARGRPAGHRAALLGSAAGILFGLSAALTKATVELLDEGLLEPLGDWHLYALVAVGWVGMTLAQRSLAAGPLAPAVATQMTLDPVTSLLLGTLAFDETIHEDTGTLLLALGAFAVMLAGVLYLALAEAPAAAARSPERRAE
jgi:drug/metabolite transporter (DMT)-like permease